MFTVDLRAPIGPIPQEPIVTKPFVSVLANGYLERQRTLIIARIVAHLDGGSATRLLTSCRRYLVISVDQALYKPILARAFPGFYPWLAAKVSKEVDTKRGLLWYRLNSLIHNPDGQVFCRHPFFVSSLDELKNGRLVSRCADQEFIWSFNGSDPIVFNRPVTSLLPTVHLADGRVATGIGTNVKLCSRDGSDLENLAMGHSMPIYCLTQLADEGIVTGSFDGTLCYRPLKGTHFTVFKGHAKPIERITQLENGSIVTGSSDGMVRVWTWPLDGSSKVLKGHGDRITSIIQLKDRIVTGSSDGTVRSWSIADDSAPIIIAGPIINSGLVDRVTCIKQFDDGIAVGYEFGAVRIWRKEPTLLFQRALEPNTKPKSRKRFTRYIAH